MSTGDPTRGHNTFDPEAVRSLVDLLGGDSGALAEIVDAFLDEAPQRLAELREGSTAGDAVLVGRAAHTLKANAAMFGAGELENLCRGLETAAREGDLGDLIQRLESIDAEWLVIRPELVALRDRGTAP